MVPKGTFVAVVAFASALNAAVIAGQAVDLQGVQQAFVGTWREDISTRKLNAAAFPELRFRKAADGSLEELRGPASASTAQPVIFDGKSRDLPSGNAIAWKQLGPASFERTVTAKGQTMSTRRVSISADGTTLTEDIETKVGDGTVKSTAVYQRASGEANGGLVGTWKGISRTADTPVTLTFEAVGSNSLRLTGAGTSTTMEINGPPVAPTGPGIGKGRTEQLRVISQSTLEGISATNGVETGRTRYELSTDRKTLRVIGSSAGGAGPPAIEVVLVKQ